MYVLHKHSIASLFHVSIMNESEHDDLVTEISASKDTNEDTQTEQLSIAVRETEKPTPKAAKELKVEHHQYYKHHHL